MENVESKAEAKSTAKKTVGLKASVMGTDGKEMGSITLPEKLFGVKPNKALLSQAVRVYLANQRAGSASSKTRGEVRGSTRKIYKQKGTGRARHGALTAPIFVGGGIAFGPKPRDFSLKFSKNMRRAALSSALSLQYGHDAMKFVDGLDFKGKTKEFVAVLSNLQLLDKKKKADRLLFIIPQTMDVVERVAKNIEGVTIEKAANINAYAILKAKKLLVMKDVVAVLEKTFAHE